jgi:hypothetical protein
MRDRPERRVGRVLQREAHVGAADVADEHGKGKGELAHGGISGKLRRDVKAGGRTPGNASILARVARSRVKPVRCAAYGRRRSRRGGACRG